MLGKILKEKNVFKYLYIVRLDMRYTLKYFFFQKNMSCHFIKRKTNEKKYLHLSLQ